MQLIPEPRHVESLRGLCAYDAPRSEVCPVSEIPRQGYRLLFGADGIRLEAADEAGLCYGRATLEQILQQDAGHDLPCMRIEDWPDFERRGYMLDISRDRVPTMTQLFHLVDLLAEFRYNELQLYTEHTFAYSQHRTVWAGASPMTGEEIRRLDAYCRERQIELVPNQNSFGHMERWLSHPEYHHLAECPGGFQHPLGGWRQHGSVLRPEPASLEFLDGLYRELLPCFSSRRFNIGGDEPWELGQGASRARVEAEGKQAVYLDFLARVCRLAETHGAEPMCWADVLLEQPDSVEQLPEGIIPVLWGYEADHPFEAQCALLAGLGRPFYAAPGDSTWASHTGRAGNMRANVQAAAETGLKYGASGLLLTHWGDGGHPQPWVVSLPALVRAGLTAWRADQTELCYEPALQAALHESADPAGLSALLQEAGQLDEGLDCPMVNRSFLAHSLHLEDRELDDFSPQPAEEGLHRQIEHCDRLLEPISRAEDRDSLFAELGLVVRMNRYAAYRCLRQTQESPEAAEEICDDYRRLWLSRSRPGGLEDSLRRMPGLRPSQ